VPRTLRSITTRCLAAAMVASTVTVVGVAPPALAQSIGLDPSFAGSGKVTIDAGDIRDVGTGVAVHPDGGVIVLGYAIRPGQLSDLIVTRLRPDGRPDATFGTSGRVTLPNHGSAGGAVVQPDGRILVASSPTVRLLANGTMDTTWRAAEPYGGGIAVQSDGFVLTGGYANDGPYIARMRTDGSLDAGFGVGGRARVEFVSPPDEFGMQSLSGIVVQRDGRIVVSGMLGYPGFISEPTSNLVLVRFTATGQLDTTFGDGGRVVADTSAGNWTPADLLLQGDGRIVAVGYVWTDGPTGWQEMALARYRSDGSPDPSFGTGGVALVRPPPTDDPRGMSWASGSMATAAAIDAAGRLVVVGRMMGFNQGDVAVTRITTRGAVDTTFNGGGWVRTDLSGENDEANAVAVQPDGKIVVVATSDVMHAGDIVVLRFVDGDPVGLLESMKVSASGRTASLSGWVADGDAASAVKVQIRVDMNLASTVVADGPRPDVGRADAHGFVGEVPLSPGNHSVCAHALNQGVGGDTLLSCQAVLVSSDPFGRLDTVARRPGGVLVEGWAIDYDTAAAVNVLVVVDGTYRQTLRAGALRPDVGVALPGTGKNHGYSGLVPLAAGMHNVCALAVNQSWGTDQWLGCKNVWVPVDPFGSLDGGVSAGGPAGVMVRGWAIDPDVAGPVTVHVYADGTFVGATVANQHRTDVEAVVPGYGPYHGYEAFLQGPGGSGHTVCTFAINQAGGANSLLGCFKG
jgi:uncharacterized delta-60 repeat protein